jgi:hypothetical protein
MFCPVLPALHCILSALTLCPLLFAHICYLYDLFCDRCSLCTSHMCSHLVTRMHAHSIDLCFSHMGCLGWHASTPSIHRTHAVSCNHSLQYCVPMYNAACMTRCVFTPSLHESIAFGACHHGTRPWICFDMRVCDCFVLACTPLRRACLYVVRSYQRWACFVISYHQLCCNGVVSGSIIVIECVSRVGGSTGCDVTGLSMARSVCAEDRPPFAA